jgi:carboxymethylenebutenolidase
VISENASAPQLTERTLQFHRPGGEMETFIVHPSSGGPFIPIILYMDMWGFRWVLFDIARRIAAAGYYCIMPDLYYRHGKVRYAPHDIKDRPLNFVDLAPERQKLLRDAMDGLSNAMVADDTAFLLDFMSHGEPVRPGPIGSVGYCMGGRHGLYIAGTYPDRFKATACLHGAGLITPGEDSAHLVARNADGEIYCGHAERDKYAPADVVERIDEALAGRRVRYERRVHKGAEHSYAMPDRDVYDPKATEQDWQSILAMFRRQLT